MSITIGANRALSKDSPIILLDEPSNNLDNRSIIRLKNLFLSGQKKINLSL